MIEAFKAIRFKPATLALIGHANEIIGEYQALGFILTLRQLFYQFVSRPALGLANTFDDYKRLGRTVTDARRAGLIDWDAIEDRTRNVHRLPTWDDPPEIVASCAEQYREDLWASQPYRPEVWIEKDALTGVIEDVCDEFRAPYFSCRGNVSEPEMYAAGKRFARIVRQGQVPIVLHLGDHDPNGVDMTRDIRERLSDVRPPGNRGQAHRAQPRPGHGPAAQLRQGERQPLRGLRPAVRDNRLLGVGRARAKRHLRPGARRARSPDRPGRMGGSDRGRGRQPRRPGRRRQQLVLGQVCVEGGPMIAADLIARARDADLVATAEASAPASSG